MALKFETVKKLSQLGYWVRYGGDGHLHIIRRSEFSRGARALCGATASKRDYHFEKEPCPECMRLCSGEVSAQQERAADLCVGCGKRYAAPGSNTCWMCIDWATSR